MPRIDIDDDVIRRTPDVKYLRHVLDTVEILNRIGPGISAIVVSPSAGRTETAYEAIAREVPRLIEDLDVYKREHKQLVDLLREMTTGEFELLSDLYRQDNDKPGELGEQRRQALMMHTSITYSTAEREEARQRMRDRGELSK